VSPTSVKAHFNNNRILWDKALQIEPNTKLIVTVYSIGDFEREE
jgi:hypothetical protein